MKVSTGTIVRTVILALALFNQVMVATGHPVIDLENDTVETFVNTAATIITAIIGWWKNNSFTGPALIGDWAMNQARAKARKEKRITVEDTGDE